jgi:hypothetical protein
MPAGEIPIAHTRRCNVERRRFRNSDRAMLARQVASDTGDGT